MYTVCYHNQIIVIIVIVSKHRPYHIGCCPISYHTVFQPFGNNIVLFAWDACILKCLMQSSGNAWSIVNHCRTNIQPMQPTVRRLLANMCWLVKVHLPLTHYKKKSWHMVWKYYVKARKLHFVFMTNNKDSLFHSITRIICIICYELSIKNYLLNLVSWAWLFLTVFSEISCGSSYITHHFHYHLYTFLG